MSPSLPFEGRLCPSDGSHDNAVDRRTKGDTADSPPPQPLCNTFRVFFGAVSVFGAKIYMSAGPAGSPQAFSPPKTPSVDFPLEKLLFDGLFAGFAIRQVEAKVRPFVGSAPIRDGDGVADSEMHRLHDALPLQLSGSPDGDGGGVAAGAEELLPAVIVALLQILEAPPDDQAVLLRDLQGREILPRDEGRGSIPKEKISILWGALGGWVAFLLMFHCPTR